MNKKLYDIDNSEKKFGVIIISHVWSKKENIESLNTAACHWKIDILSRVHVGPSFFVDVFVKLRRSNECKMLMLNVGWQMTTSLYLLVYLKKGSLVLPWSESL